MAVPGVRRLHSGSRPPRGRAARPPPPRAAVTCPPRVPRRRTAAPRPPREVFSSRKAGSALSPSGAAPAAEQGPPRDAAVGSLRARCPPSAPSSERPGSPHLGGSLPARGAAPAAGPALPEAPHNPPPSQPGTEVKWSPGPGERKTVESFSHRVTAGSRRLRVRPLPAFKLQELRGVSLPHGLDS